MKHHRLLSAAVFCACATAVLPLALAQTAASTSDTASAQADDLTHRGVDLLKKHQWAEAEDLFRRAWALKRSYDIAGNLGLAEAGLGKWRDAAEHLTFAIETFPANGKAAHRDLLREKLASAREHVGGLTIGVDAPGAEVLVDGKRVGTAPLPGEVLVEPGAHVVEAQLAGRGSARGEATVAEGGSLSVTLVLKSEHAPPPPPIVPVKRSIVPGAVLAGVGGAALVTGAVLLALGESKRSGVNSLSAQTDHTCVVHDPAPHGACAQLASAATQADTLGNGGIVALVVAGAAAVGATTYMLWPTSRRDTGTARRVYVVPTASMTGGGVILSGSF